jgi:hypothetical protein
MFLPMMGVPTQVKMPAIRIAAIAIRMLQMRMQALLSQIKPGMISGFVLTLFATTAVPTAPIAPIALVVAKFVPPAVAAVAILVVEHYQQNGCWNLCILKSVGALFPLESGCGVDPIIALIAPCGCTMLNSEMPIQHYFAWEICRIQPTWTQLSVCVS